MSKLRILNVIVQPIIVVDDGNELTPGPSLNPVTVPVSQLAFLADRLPIELVNLQAEFDAQRAEPELSTPDSTTRLQS